LNYILVQQLLTTSASAGTLPQEEILKFPFPEGVADEV